MWAYILRRVLYNIPIFIGIIAVVFFALRAGQYLSDVDPVDAFLGKNATLEQTQLLRESMGLDRHVMVQYADFLGQVFTMDFKGTSWVTPVPVTDKLAAAVGPSLAISLPSLLLTTLLAICVGLVSAFFRGRWPDRTLMFVAVLGMCISYLVYIVFGQHYGAYVPTKAFGGDWIFSIDGFKSHDESWSLGVWAKYCLLPVLINVTVALGYDTRYYRAVMVEECNRDYITTAVAKGASKRKVMFVHMLKNAMIPIITRVMITLPFLLVGSLLLEVYFRIPGMGRELIMAIEQKDFPVVQTFTAIFAMVFIATNILTDVLYALVDPRVRLQ